MPLTDVAIRGAKPPAKTTRLFDAGGRWWRWKYYFAGKGKWLALGAAFPAIL